MANEPEALVLDSSPLITLGRAGALEIIQSLPFRFLVPSAVAHEITAGSLQGWPVSVPSWIEVQQLKTPVSQLAVRSLDRGEAEVISLALELQLPRVCIDEWRGRRMASALGLEVTGSLGLLGLAKTSGIIGEIRPWAAKVVSTGGRFDFRLIQQFLAAFGEE